MYALYHIDYHCNPETDDIAHKHFFYIWDEEDNFKCINSLRLHEESKINPPKNLFGKPRDVMGDFLNEIKDDEITPVARSITKEEATQYMLTYALLHDIPTSL